MTTDAEAAVVALLTAAKVAHTSVQEVGARVLVTCPPYTEGVPNGYPENVVARIYARSKDWAVMYGRDVAAQQDKYWLTRRK